MNEHIIEYCDNFITTEESPKFAIFIKGGWGTGKTYFINRLIESYPQKKEINCGEEKEYITRDEFLYISLFGITSTEDIDTKIYQAVHPLLSSKGAQIAGAVLKSVIKLGANIDFNKDGRDDLSISFDNLLPIENDGTVSKLKYKVIIIDDLERAEIPTSQIFGYFSQMISESDYRLIFIGNEEKIYPDYKYLPKRTHLIKIIGTPNLSEYNLIKEKVIGVEFQLSPDFKNAIKSFLAEFKYNSYSKLISSYLNEVIENLKCDNLRTIRQCLYNLKLILSTLGRKVLKKDKELICYYFIILFLQKSLNLITENDPIEKVITVYNKYHKSYKDYKESIDANKLDYSVLFSDIYIPFFSEWTDLIFNGNYNSDKLIKVYKAEKAEQLEKATNENPIPLFQLISNWRKYEEKDFKSLVENVKNEFVNGVYLNPGLILHFANIFYIFSQWGLIPDTKESIQNLIESFFEHFENNIIPLKDWYQLDIGYGGFAYSLEIPEIENVKEKLRIINEKRLSQLVKEDLSNLLTNLEINIDSFIKDIIHVNGTNKYYNQPVMKLIDIDKFYRCFIKLTAGEQEQVLNAFEERYGLYYSNGTLKKEYKEDYDNWIQFEQKYKKNCVDFTYNPQLMFLNQNLRKIRKIINYFEKQMNIAITVFI